MSATRTIMRSLKIAEISAVARPAQEHARVAFLKSADPLMVGGETSLHKARPGVMTRFAITELSGVRSPAQTGARAVFMKSAPAAIQTKADLLDAIRTIGRAADVEVEKARIVRAARRLGLTPELPSGWLIAKAITVEEHRHTIWHSADPADPDAAEDDQTGDEQDPDPDDDGDDDELNPADKAIAKMAQRGAELRFGKGVDAYGSPVRAVPAAGAIQRSPGGPGQTNGAAADGQDAWALRKAATHAALTKEAAARAAVTGRSPEAEFTAMLFDGSPEAETLASWLR